MSLRSTSHQRLQCRTSSSPAPGHGIRCFTVTMASLGITLSEPCSWCGRPRTRSGPPRRSSATTTPVGNVSSTWEKAPGAALVMTCSTHCSASSRPASSVSTDRPPHRASATSKHAGAGPRPSRCRIGPATTTISTSTHGEPTRLGRVRGDCIDHERVIDDSPADLTAHHRTDRRLVDDLSGGAPNRGPLHLTTAEVPIGACRGVGSEEAELGQSLPPRLRRGGGTRIATVVVDAGAYVPIWAASCGPRMNVLYRALLIVRCAVVFPVIGDER